MDYQEIQKASRKFEVKLATFIEEYLREYPTHDAIRQRYDDGELLCIDYRTLEISVRNKSELEEVQDEFNHSFWGRFKNLHSYDFLFCTKGGCREESRRIVNHEETNGIAYGAVEAYVGHNKISDYWSLPSYLLPTAEEIAAEMEQERIHKEKQEQKRIEKERIKAEHSFRPDATPAMLIIPDVHGRTFWKKAVDTYTSLPIVFLGDYLDPYNNSIECIKADSALVNFKEIIQFKYAHNEQVTLLFGNHDLHYLSDNIDCSRKDTKRKPEIRQLFADNMQDFTMALCKHVADKTFLFSHAGIVPGWLDIRFPDIDKSDAQAICDALNKRLKTDSSFKHTLVADASCYRGGPSKFGSPVWADIVEHEENEPYTTKKKDYPYLLPGNVMQIFGHTQQEKEPIYRSHFCCLDCRRPFILTSDGQIMEAY